MYVCIYIYMHNTYMYIVCVYVYTLLYMYAHAVYTLCLLSYTVDHPRCGKNAVSNCIARYALNPRWYAAR